MYLDTIASNYMCADSRLLVEIKEVVDRRVSFVGESIVRVKGCGKNYFSQNEKVTQIEDVYYVPVMHTIYMKGQLMHVKDKKERLIHSWRWLGTACLNST